MTDYGVQHDIIRIERTYPASPARVFGAWADPAARERWFVQEDGWVCEYHQDFRVGGRESGRFVQPAGTAYHNETVFHDIVPNRRIVFAYSMARGDDRILASLATVELAPVAAGTRLLFTEQIALLDGRDQAADREAGWRDLLAKLATELDRTTTAT